MGTPASKKYIIPAIPSRRGCSIDAPATAGTLSATMTNAPLEAEEGRPAFPIDNTSAAQHNTTTPELAPDSEVTLEMQVCWARGGMRFCERLTPNAKQSETSAGAFNDAHNETDAANTSQQHEENTAEAMLVRTAANIAPDATWTQLFTLWPWPSFKDASLEAAFQASHFVCLLVGWLVRCSLPFIRRFKAILLSTFSICS